MTAGGDTPGLRRETVRELDRRAIEEYGIPSMLLMENAGRASADEAEAILRERGWRDVLVLCGPGNNGGDGFVVARTLHNRGFEAEVVFVGPPEKLEESSEDVLLQERLWRGLGKSIAYVPDVEAARELRARIDLVPLVVDALFGTGLSRPLREPWATVVRELVASQRAVLAVDVPSGLEADTGEVLGEAVRADVTVTFVAPKPGLATGRGPELAGRVVVAEIGVPRHLIEAARPGSR